MPENNQYSDYERNTFTPVAIVLVVAIAVVLGIFVYARSQDAAMPGDVPLRGPAPASPAEPVVPGTGIPANPSTAN